MPDATITSTASTFGTISGVFSADQSTISGTISGIVPGTLTGSVGVPGPAGPAGIGLPAGGTSGQFLQKTSGVDYATDWVTLNLSAYAVKANNLSDLSSASTARTNLGLGSLAVVNDAPSDGSQYARKNAAWEVVTTTPDFISSVSSPLSVTSGNLTIDLSAYAPLASPVFTGDARAVTPAFGDNDTSISTTAFVQAALAGGTAVAKNLEVYVRNQTGSTIPAGRIVYISGATGNKPLITLAQANNDANSAQTMGFTKTAIANNGFGYVIVRGELENIDTSALTEGAQLYLSPTTAGTWTTTKPSAPQHLVYVGIVVRAHPTQGIILVAVQNGYELGEIHDVALSGLANNDLLAYESSTDLWKNKTYSALGLLTSAAAASTYYPLTGNPSGFITSSALTGYATESWVTAGFYPLTGNPSGFITSAALSPYLLSSTAASTYQTQAGMSSYLTTSAAATNYVAKSGSSMTGGLTFSAGGYIGSFSMLAGNSIIIPDGGAEIYETVLQNPGLLIRDASNVVLARFQADQVIIPSAGITFSDATTQTTAGISASTAASTYQTIAGMSSYAPKASPALTGNVTITSNSTGAALFIEQSGTGNILTLHDQASDTTFVAIDQNGKVNTIASDATAGAGFNIAHGTAPTTPVNGDVWTTTSGLFMRQNGVTRQYVDFDGTQTINGAKTFSNASQTLGNSTLAGTIAIGSGATVSGSTRTINIGTASAAGSTNAINIGGGSGTITTTLNGTTNFTGPITGAINNITLGNGTAASTFNLFTGATVSGSTKAVAIASGGAAGSTTTVTIGNTTGSTTTLQGTTNGVTLAADTNSTALATTAYVVGQAGSATPLVDGTAAVGTSLRYARQDHVHPTDTTRAALASPTFTGTPAAPTAAVDTNTTQIATTAYVVGQGYAKLASPTFTGTPSLPTGTTAVTQTAGNNTTAVATTAFVTAAVPAFATLAESIGGAVTNKIIAPDDAEFLVTNADLLPINRPQLTSVTSGGGASALTTGFTSYVNAPNAAAGHAVLKTFGTSQNDQLFAFWNSTGYYGINYSKRIHLSGRCAIDPLTDTNITALVTFGKLSADAAGDLTRKGIGWKYQLGGGANYLNLIVHNGTSQTAVATTFQQSGTTPFSWDIVSDGSGGVKLYIDGVERASTSSGPTGTMTSNTPCYTEEIVAAAAAAVSYQRLTTTRGFIYVQTK